MIKEEPLLSLNKTGTNSANTFPWTLKTAVDDGAFQIVSPGCGVASVLTVPSGQSRERISLPQRAG